MARAIKEDSSLPLTGVERTFGKNDLIVSKTDTTGKITYGNGIFIHLAGYDEKHLIGAPHSIIRHPEMPRCVFKLLWDTIGSGKEIFAYVLNRAANGDHYWVFAHVTPSRDASGKIVGFHSNRRVPDRRILTQTIMPLYKTLQTEEDKHANRKEGMNAGYSMLADILKQKDTTYEKFRGCRR